MGTYKVVPPSGGNELVLGGWILRGEALDGNEPCRGRSGKFVIVTIHQGVVEGSGCSAESGWIHREA